MKHTSRAPLRLLLVTDGRTIPNWLYKCLHAVEESKVATVVLALLAAHTEGRTPRHLLFSLYERIDRSLFRTDADALVPIGLQAALEWFEFWRGERMKWLVGLGVRAEKLRFHQHTKDELAHYAKDAYDVQYEFPFGWQEFEGIHNRTNFDLSRHQEFSGKKLEYLDVATNERFIPYVVETSAGADRTTLVVMVDAYHEDEVEGEKRVVLRLHPALAPLTAAVFPLVNKAYAAA